METQCVRFDDLSPGGSGSFGLADIAATVVARRLEDVVPAIEEAEAAARRGLWVAGFVAYEAAPAFNPLLTVRPPSLHDPMRDLPLVRFQAFRKRIELEQFDSLQFPTGEYNVSAWTADSSADEYREDLATIGRAIMAGEVTQLTHTFRLHAAFNGDPAALYRDLVLSQRGRHAACVDVERYRLVSASPVGFLRRVGSELIVRPVLASIERGRWLEEDVELASLLHVEGEENYANRLVVKEIEADLAEVGDLVMTRGGDRFSLERLETLWHLVTEVRAQLAPGTRVVDIFKALFPPVSVTGVPKIEAMNLIAATEDTPRGVYCGAIGFLAPSDGGDVDANFNVAVRTVVVDQEEGVAQFGVGTPITNRSHVASAYEEARLKAKVLVDRRPDFELIAEIRCENGAPLHAEDELARLAESAEYFGFAIDRARIDEALAGAAASDDSSRLVTISLTRDGDFRMEESLAPRWHEGPDGAPVLIGAIANRSVSSRNVFSFHKTTNRRVAETLTRKHADADVVIVCNEQDEVAGALVGNVAVLVNGEWMTPPIGSGTTPTAFRHRLIADGKLVEHPIGRQDLLAALEVGIIDDIHGWRIVGLVA